MKTAIKRLARSRQARLHEEIREAFDGATVTDGVVDRVAILGLTSLNHREYDATGVKEAVSAGRFTGVQVYMDHTAEGDDGEVRTFRDLIGVTGVAEFDGTMVRAPIHVVKSDPNGAKFLEMASRPELAAAIGMSQDAEGRLLEREGQPDLVTEITKVVSVDVVTRPATTATLFESANRAGGPIVRKLLEMKAGARVAIRSAEGDDTAGVVSGGPFFEVETSDGEKRLVPAALMTEMGDHPPEETDEEGGDDEKPDDEKKVIPASEMDDEPDDKETKESDMSDAERAELLTLRESNAIHQTANAVTSACAGLPEEVAAKVREKFDGKKATDDEVKTYVAEVTAIVSAFAESHELEMTGFGPRTDVESPSELEGAPAVTLLHEAFSSLTGVEFKEVK